MFEKACIGLAVLLFVTLSARAWAQNDEQEEKFLLSCPASPNCVSSTSCEAQHRVAPFSLYGDMATGWDVVREAVKELPRLRMIAESENELHLECRSRVFRFVDDLQLFLDSETKTVHVRSASRVGYWDFGVNRRRVEALRALLQKKGVVR